MVTKAERDRKNANAEFRNMMDELVTHVRVGQGRDNTRVTLVGHARDLHGLDGCCACCPRRPAGEPSTREVAAAAARAVAQLAAERGPRHPSPLLVDELVDVELVAAAQAEAIARARAAAVDSAERLSRRD